jgi:hypothetical protein
MQVNDPTALAGRLSPDGMWQWNGTSWVRAERPTPAPGSAPISSGQRSWLATSGGIVAIVAIVVVIVGCSIPYVAYKDTTSGTTTTSSVFNGGFSGSWGDIVEPAIVILFSLAASILVTAWMNRTAQAFASGALLAMGAQTFAMFVGYVAAGAGNGQLQAGSYVGLLGAILLFVGGGMAAASLLSPQARQS